MQRTTWWVLAVLGCTIPVEQSTLSNGLRERTLERVVIARMYQRNHWVIAGVDPSDRQAAAQYVCDAIAPLRPTYVSGLVRLNAEDEISEEQEDMFRRVRRCILERSPHEHRVRFDVVLNALHYTDGTPEEGGHLTAEQLRERLRARRRSIEDRLEPDGYFFDFFSQPWVRDDGDEGPYRPDVLEREIERMHDDGLFAAGNVWGGHVPPGADFVAITDARGRDGVRESAERIRAQGTPVLLHIRNDPHIAGSGGRLWNERDRAYRKRQLRRHVRWANDFDLSYMFPVFFPLRPNPSERGGPWVAYDASADGNMLERMAEYLGGGERRARLMSASGEDAVPSAYDPDDDGLVRVHRSQNRDAGQHLYTTSMLEIEDARALTLEVEGYFSLSRVHAEGTAPLVRCYAGAGDHVLTIDASCEGAANEGVVGYIATAPVEGTVPLHRMYRGGERPDHFFTTSAPERYIAGALGYRDEGIVGYVWDELGIAVLETARTPIYRGVHGETGQHLFSRSLDEILNGPGLTFERVAFHLDGSPSAGTVPWHRCYLGTGWHLYTRSASCEGAPDAAYEGVLGHIATSPLPGTVPLYRLFKSGARRDHFYTTDANERGFAVSIGYADEGVAGYVWPS